MQLILVDGSSFLYRAFHAIPALTTREGQPSGAIYGVVAMLKKLKREMDGFHIAVVFDSPTPTTRHKLYPPYKANRIKIPKELQQQIPIVQSIIEAMGFPLIKQEGVEADDIIGSLVKRAQQLNMTTVIATSDKDFAQLVNDQVTLFNAMTNLTLDVSGVIARFKVKPEQMIDYLSLIGDTSDNIPGVPMVGPKTAAKWLDTYGSLDQIIANAASIKGKVGENLRAHLPYFALSKQLITIDQNMVVDFDLSTLGSHQENSLVLKKWFEKLEFKQWFKELSDSEQVMDYSFQEYTLILEKAQFFSWLNKIKQVERVAIDLETTSLNTLQAKLVGIALAIDKEQAYIPLQHDDHQVLTQLDIQWVLSALKPWLEDTKQVKIGHNLKYDIGVFANYAIELKGIYSDTLIASYLLDSQKEHSLDALAWEYLRYKTIPFEQVVGKGKTQLSFNQVKIENAAPYAAEDAGVCLALHHLFESKLRQHTGLSFIHDYLEIPLISLLSQIERYGVLVDATRLIAHSQLLEKQLEKLEKESLVQAGEIFNLNSPKQLQEILYTKHRLPILAKTTGGQPSTSESVLQLLAMEHELPRLILEYRTLNKLKSTYTDTLPKQLHQRTNRIHTAYHQAVVSTGRLSSSNPNLQNIPIRTEEGRKIRQAFIAPADYTLLSADYSQIELRIMAHFSQDAALLHAFQNDLDVHTATAAELFDVSLTSVNAEQRRRAKVINFGLIYGISSFGLAKQLQVSIEIAQKIITQYFERYPGVRQYMDTARKLTKQGYVETLWGRKLILPKSNGPHIYRNALERIAINAPLQGTAADIIKKAMLVVHEKLKQEKIEAHIIMQVHDELVFEVRENYLNIAKQCIVESMQNVANLNVPTPVSVGIGRNWQEAH